MLRHVNAAILNVRSIGLLAGTLGFPHQINRQSMFAQFVTKRDMKTRGCQLVCGFSLDSQALYLLSDVVVVAFDDFTPCNLVKKASRLLNLLFGAKLDVLTAKLLVF